MMEIFTDSDSTLLPGQDDCFTKPDCVFYNQMSLAFPCAAFYILAFLWQKLKYPAPLFTFFPYGFKRLLVLFALPFWTQLLTGTSYSFSMLMPHLVIRADTRARDMTAWGVWTGVLCVVAMLVEPATGKTVLTWMFLPVWINSMVTLFRHGWNLWGIGLMMGSVPLIVIMAAGIRSTDNWHDLGAIIDMTTCFPMMLAGQLSMALHGLPDVFEEQGEELKSSEQEI